MSKLRRLAGVAAICDRGLARIRTAIIERGHTSAHSQPTVVAGHVDSRRHKMNVKPQVGLTYLQPTIALHLDRKRLHEIGHVGSDLSCSLITFIGVLLEGFHYDMIEKKRYLRVDIGRLIRLDVYDGVD